MADSEDFTRFAIYDLMMILTEAICRQPNVDAVKLREDLLDINFMLAQAISDAARNKYVQDVIERMAEKMEFSEGIEPRKKPNSTT